MTAVIATMLLLPLFARSSKEEHVQTDLERRQATWLSALEWCESRGVETAINKKDRDGTPSYGALQFKPSTYAYFAKVYGLASTTDYMSAEGQREIVARMIADPSVKWTQQFPDCVKHFVGFPPTN